jgi:hypothetical protein
LSEESNDFVTVKDNNITVPQLILTFLHAGVGCVRLVEVNRFEELERAPAMVHENLVVKVCAVIAVHGETAGLSKGVNNSGMRVILTPSLDSAVAETRRSLQSSAVENNLINRPVVVMEASERTDSAIHHGTVETGSCFTSDTIAQSLHLGFDFAGGILERLLETAVLESNHTAGMLLKFSLALCLS